MPCRVYTCRACKRATVRGLSAIPATVPEANAATVPPVYPASRPAKTLTENPNRAAGFRRPFDRPATVSETGIFAPLFSTVKHETPNLQGRNRPAVAVCGIFTRRNTPAPEAATVCRK